MNILVILAVLHAVKHVTGFIAQHVFFFPQKGDFDLHFAFVRKTVSFSLNTVGELYLFGAIFALHSMSGIDTLAVART